MRFQTVRSHATGFIDTLIIEARNDDESRKIKKLNTLIKDKKVFWKITHGELMIFPVGNTGTKKEDSLLSVEMKSHLLPDYAVFVKKRLLSRIIKVYGQRTFIQHGALEIKEHISWYRKLIHCFRE